MPLRRAFRTDGVSAHPSIETQQADDQPSEKANADRTGEHGRRSFMRPRLIGLSGLLIFAVIMGFPAGFIVGNHSFNPSLGGLTDAPSMDQCMHDALALLALKQSPTTEILGQLVGYCYSLSHSQGLLKDFAVRELNFVQQYRANGILLWMVVVVTLSGVLLAGLQLMASYQLASANWTTLGPDNELSLQHDRIVLKSSITGLCILLLSFAFFLVFVLYVYRFERPEVQSKAEQLVPTLPMGGLGPPPPKPGNP
jgi:hypothetical protein